MAIERKDVRFKLDEADHAALKEICDVAGMDVGDFVESIIVPEIRRRAHEAIELAERLQRRGISGRGRESSGAAGNNRDRSGGLR